MAHARAQDVVEQATGGQQTGAAKSPSGEHDPLVGRWLDDRYRLLSLIAAGAMGRVYRAEQAPLGRICAVKVLQPTIEGETEDEFRKRFLAEASVAAKLQHSNTVKIFDYGRTADQIYYMAMEHLEGETLYAVLRRGALAPAHAVKIAYQVCRSLREAHAHGVIHRDLKPANIFLVRRPEGELVKVLDFGLMKSTARDTGDSTRPGLVAGSPKYMSPEQLEEQPVTARSDIYSLGVVLYEMLAGRPPFDAANAIEVLLAHKHDPPPPFEVAAPHVLVVPSLQEVVFCCLQKDPGDRYSSMDELAQAIKLASRSPSGSRTTLSIHATLASGASPGTPSPSSHAGPSSVPPPRTSVLPQRSSLPDLRTSGETPRVTLTSGEIRSSVPALAAVLDSPPARNELPATSAAPPAIKRAGEASERGFRAGLLVGVAVAVALVGVFSALVLTGTLRLGGASASARAANAGAPRGVRVDLQSDPPGAEVLEGTASLGRTPLRLAWSGERGDPARSHTFVFRLSGRRDVQVTLVGESLEHLVRMPPADDVPGVAATAARVPAAGAGSPGGTSGGTSGASGGRSTGRSRREPAGGTPSGYRDLDDW